MNHITKRRSAGGRHACAGLVVCAAAVGYVLADGVLGEVLFQLVCWGSVVGFFWGVRRNGTATLPWVSIGCGLIAFALGDLMFSLNEYVFAIEPFPSVADVFYLAGYPLMAGGLSGLVRRARPDGDRVALIDAAIVLVPSAVVGWIYLIDPYATESGSTTLERLVAGSYPLGDLLCLAVLIRLLSGASGSWRQVPAALVWLAGGLFAMFVADVGFVLSQLHGNYQSGGVVDAIYLVPYVAAAVCALDPSVGRIGEPQPSVDPSLGPLRLAFLAVAALVTPLLLIAERDSAQSTQIPLVVGATAISFLLVLARMSNLVEALEASRAQLAYDASHDHLTGLANRSLFARHLDDGLGFDTPGALLFIDLDKFKAVNDQLGHRAGDELLVNVGEAIRGSVRTNDVVARLSGDEFAVLMPGATEATAHLIAQRLISALRIACNPDGSLSITASIGVVTWGDDTAPLTAEALLAAADHAMYAAKAADGNSFVTASG
ncbi:MAG TPA: diguanylate cyclase [Ilumatobacter sp.]|nr:diguanylate cyclase [Ilumatobacter sp.]